MSKASDSILNNYPGIVINYNAQTGEIAWTGGVQVTSAIGETLLNNTIQIEDVRAKMIRKDKKHIAALLDKAANDAEDWQIEYRIRINNKTIWLSEHAQSFDIKNKPMISLFIQDVTKNKKKAFHREKVLDTAAQKVSHKNDFVSSMSHEIRTPMNAVMGMAQILAKTPLNSEQKRYISTITESSFALVQVINDILDVSKFEAGSIELSPERVNIEKLCLDLCNNLVDKTTEKQTRLYLDFNAMESRIVSCDKERLTQLLTNLLTNAIKYTDIGYIKLHVKSLKRKLKTTDIEFSVIDTGIGIQKKLHTKLFSAFTQGDSDYAKTFGGTGLGLQICQHIANLMGDRIKLVSAPNNGSTFSFTISMNNAADAPEISKTPNLRCLLVHNDKRDLDQITRVLKSNNLKTLIVTDSEDALAAVIREDKFEIIIIAKDMPGIDGVRLSEMIRKDDAYESVPIVLITNSTDQIDSDTLTKSNINAYYSTPASPSLIENSIMHALKFKDKKPQATFISSASILDEDDESSKSIQATGTALIVDDIEVNRLILNSFLSYVGLSTEFACNGQEALDKVTNNDFDIVFMDCRMPIMNGYDATSAIRKIESDRSKVPIVALTANAHESDKAQCLDAGMNDFMTKPFSENMLNNILRKWIQVTEIQTNSIQQKTNDNVGDDEEFFDHIQFTKLQQMMGEKFQEFALSMPEKFTKYREEIKQHLKLADLEASREKAHALKGLSGLIGAKGVATEAYAIETASKEENIELVNIGLTKLENAIFKTKEIINDKIKPESDDMVVFF